ncbi:MAG: galactose-1-phosphate uridylyltransferase [Candidatus Paceibacterota bacterium]|jgi:UDPglucose--hexose-1-phosphate uridylyltransferase
MEKKKTELRYDVLSNEWVMVSPKRGARPNNFQEINDCPFCDIKDQKPPKYYFYKGKENKEKKWTTIVIPNKFPVFEEDDLSGDYLENNFYTKKRSPGFHDLIVTKEHNKFISDLPISRIEEFFSCIQKILIEYRKSGIVKQVAIFHNRGEKAGASQPHPHYQALSLPIVERENKNELNNFKNFYKKNGKCLQCQMNKIETENKERLILENDDFIAFCPFAPKTLFQVIIAPKRHMSSFDQINEKEKKSLSKIFKKVLLKYDNGFDNLDYNFFLHNSPLDKEYPYFHWYWSFSPRINYFGGLELGFGLEISSMTPEDQAKKLRKM